MAELARYRYSFKWRNIGAKPTSSNSSSDLLLGRIGFSASVQNSTIDEVVEEVVI